MKLSDPVTVVKGVGPKMKEILGRVSVHTVEDLLSYYPRHYEDHTVIIKMEDIRGNEEVNVYGEVVDFREMRVKRNMTISTALISDRTGAVELVYFNQPWRKEQFIIGRKVLAYGKAEYHYRRWQMNHAEVEWATPDELFQYQRLIPIYPLVDGLKMTQIRNFVQDALSHVTDVTENLPQETLVRERLMGRKEAWDIIHFPKNWKMRNIARRRIAFEELFFMQAGIQLLRSHREKNTMGVKCTPGGALVKALLGKLPFQLTEGQEKAFHDIEDDMEGFVPMQRLIQGDVGSGKTAVAALALAKIVENGYQGALMAPTEVLAAQHYKTFLEFFQGLPVNIAYLSGHTSMAERKNIREKLKTRQIDILIGTHALIEDKVVFSDLGLVITDEQHRFGVKQRQALENKGEAPHVLVMTATPIPRTMALSVYGDLDISSIRGLPPGRHAVKTYAVGADMLERIHRFMGKEIEAGHQVYVVCPLVEESEKQDLAAAVSVYEKFKNDIFPNYEIGLVHGRMKSEEKETVMKKFHDGEIKLLVATSVIEVGVNVPNATIMFVYGADRFGLSQLHQLRGRVGRGKSQAYCILYSDNRNEMTELRLKLMCDIQDGFLLSEKDLLLRGSGEFFGYHQHGMPDLKAADIVKDLPLLEIAKKEAKVAVQNGMNFREELQKRFGGQFFKQIYGENTRKNT